MAYKTKGVNSWSGCCEDCFNCRYDDCKKPAYLMKSPNEDELRGRVNGRAKGRKSNG